VENLRGKLLVASPALQDPNFVRSVVLITEHGEEGAMGIVLNRPADAEVEEVLPELASIAVAEPVFVGGPVQPESLVVLGEFTDPDKAAWIVVADVGLVSASTDLDELPEAVRRGRVYAGFSGWGPGQLEGELEEEAWIVEAPQREELFSDEPEGLWAAVLRRMGREFALLSTMPPDPSLN